MNDLGGAQLGSERQSRQELNHCPGQVQGVGMNQGAAHPGTLGPDEAGYQLQSPVTQIQVTLPPIPHSLWTWYWTSLAVEQARVGQSTFALFCCVPQVR